MHSAIQGTEAQSLLPGVCAPAEVTLNVAASRGGRRQCSVPGVGWQVTSVCKEGNGELGGQASRGSLPAWLPQGEGLARGRASGLFTVASLAPETSAWVIAGALSVFPE